MNKTNFILCLLFFGAIFSSCNQKNTVSEISSPKKPNVLIILTNNQTWSAIDKHAIENIDTPFITKLASESYQFNNFFVSTLSAPTRAGILTGRYPLRTGVNGLSKRKEVMRNTELSIAELFRDADYRCSYFGKWHNGLQYPNNAIGQGFEHFFGFSASHLNNYFNAELSCNYEKVSTKGYITDLLADSAINEIGKSVIPFFMYLDFVTPNDPIQVPEKYFNKYHEKGFNNELSAYYGMLENLDDNIGKILNKIHLLGLENNTIVLFLNEKTNENWGNIGNHKVSLLMRIPWLTNTKTEINSMAAHIDIMPTISKLCNLEIPLGLKIDGMDLRPFLDDSELKMDRTIFCCDRTDKSIPHGLLNQKYLLSIKTDTSLYDLEKDPNLKNNISSKNKDITQELSKKYHDWHKDVTAFACRKIPISIGYNKYPIVDLPVNEAVLSQNLDCKGQYDWSDDWVNNLKNTNDTISWEIDCIESASYSVKIKIISPKENIGSELVIGSDFFSIPFKIAKTYKSKKTTRDNFFPGNEIIEIKWEELQIDKIHLTKGICDLYIKPFNKNLPQAVQIKSMEIVKNRKKIK